MALLDVHETQVLGVFRQDGGDYTRSNVPILPNGAAQARSRVKRIFAFDMPPKYDRKNYPSDLDMRLRHDLSVLSNGYARQ